MSAYKKITTQFKNLESLKKALADIGFSNFDLAPSPRVNSLSLTGYTGRQGDDVALRLPRSHYGNYEDTGFAWDETTQTYRAIISTHDGYGNFGEDTLNKVRQRYAFHEVSRQARLKGYSVKQINDQSGVIRLQLVKL